MFISVCWMCAWVYLHGSVHEWVYVSACVYICMYIGVDTCMLVHVRIWVYTYVSVCTCENMYLCLCMFMIVWYSDSDPFVRSGPVMRDSELCSL